MIAIVFGLLSLYVLGIFLAQPWLLTKLENLEDEGTFENFEDDFLDDARPFMAWLAATFWLAILIAWGATSLYSWLLALRAGPHEH